MRIGSLTELIVANQLDIDCTDNIALEAMLKQKEKKSKASLAVKI